MEKIYFSQPSEFTDMIEVSGCYFDCKGKLLLLKRALHKPGPATWGVPAGKKETDETPVETVIREVYEEINVRVNSSDLIFFNTIWVKTFYLSYCFKMFYAKLDEFPKLIINQEEHTDYRWVTLAEARNLPLIMGGAEALNLFEDYLLKIK